LQAAQHHTCTATSLLLLLQAPPTESQVVRAHADNARLSRANQLLEEEKDEVKHMNQMVQYAKCVAVRDKQMQVRRVRSTRLFHHAELRMGSGLCLLLVFDESA
jgi:hypothetical protein